MTGISPHIDVCPEAPSANLARESCPSVPVGMCPLGVGSNGSTRPFVGVRPPSLSPAGSVQVGGHRSTRVRSIVGTPVRARESLQVEIVAKTDRGNRLPVQTLSIEAASRESADKLRTALDAFGAEVDAARPVVRVALTRGSEEIVELLNAIRRYVEAQAERTAVIELDGRSYLMDALRA
jgi:hypothetical protein